MVVLRMQHDEKRFTEIVTCDKIEISLATVNMGSSNAYILGALPPLYMPKISVLTTLLQLCYSVVTIFLPIDLCSVMYV